VNTNYVVANCIIKIKTD